jgi:hypothetical protein
MKKYIIIVMIIWVGVSYYCTQVVNNQMLKYQQKSEKMICKDKQYIVFALGFNHNGRIDIAKSINQPIIKSGKANEELAKFIFENRHCFSTIFTQRAISDVWLLNKKMKYSKKNSTEADYGILIDSSTKVYQMHKDDSQIAVRTFEALQCALNRLNIKKKKIVLVAHDTHFKRAFFDLSTIYPPINIINPDIHNISYSSFGESILWRGREFFFARPFDVYNSLTLPCKCQTAVALPFIKTYQNLPRGGN